MTEKVSNLALESTIRKRGLNKTAKKTPLNQFEGGLKCDRLRIMRIDVK